MFTITQIKRTQNNKIYYENYNLDFMLVYDLASLRFGHKTQFALWFDHDLISI